MPIGRPVFRSRQEGYTSQQSAMSVTRRSPAATGGRTRGWPGEAAHDFATGRTRPSLNRGASECLPPPELNRVCPPVHDNLDPAQAVRFDPDLSQRRAGPWGWTPKSPGSRASGALGAAHPRNDRTAITTKSCSARACVKRQTMLVEEPDVSRSFELPPKLLLTLQPQFDLSDPGSAPLPGEPSRS